MNSPATALIWELWRKNRSGFAALGLLFAVCAGLTGLFGYEQRQAAVYDQRFYDLSGSFPLNQAMSIPSKGLVANVCVFHPLDVVDEVLVWPETDKTSKLFPLGLLAQKLQNLDRTDAGEFVLKARLPFSYHVYRLPVSSDTKLRWSDMHSASRQFRLAIGSQKLFQGPVSPAASLSWFLGDGRKVSSRPLIPRLSEATAYTDAWRNSGLIPLGMFWSDWGLPWSSVLFAFSVLAVFAIFAGTEPNAARGFTGIPPRRFALPVRTSTLITWPILLGGAAMVILVLAWSRLVLQPLLPSGIAMPQFYLTLLLLAALVVFQALVWGLPSFPKTRAVLIIVLVLGLIPLAALAFSMQHAGGEWPENWSRWKWRLEGIFAVAWLGGIAAAGWGAQQERHGGWAGWQRVSIVADALWKASPRPLEFYSPLHAQFWVEWRRNCRMPMLVWAVVAWLAPATAWLLSRGELLQFGFRGNLGFFTTFSLLIFLGIVGLNLARDGSSKRLALSSFTATRPLTSGSLLTAKLAAGVATWLLALTLSLFSVLVVAAAAGTLDQLPWPLHNESASSFAGLLLVAAISFHLFIGILPLCLTGRIPGFPWSLLPLLVMCGGVVNGFQWVDQHHAYHLLFVVLVVAALLKLAVAYWGFRRAVLLRLISPLFVAGYSVVWLFATAAVVAVVQPIMLRAAWAEDMLFFLPSAVLSVPLARIALSPLALALNRHR